jgi:hypothetical protein
MFLALGVIAAERWAMAALSCPLHPTVQKNARSLAGVPIA